MNQDSVDQVAKVIAAAIIALAVVGFVAILAGVWTLLW